MKVQRKEVNIFNMSLLDILCGALGAFCFLMLVLFPYWKPEGLHADKIPDLRKEAAELREKLKQMGVSPDVLEKLREADVAMRKALAAKQDTAELQRQLDELKKQLPDGARGQFEDMQKKYAKMQAEIDAARKLAADAQAQAAALQRELEELKKSGQMQGMQEQMRKQQEILERTQAAERAAQQKAQQLEGQLTEQRKKTEELQSRMPFSVLLSWGSAKHNIDLYVRYLGQKKDGTPFMEPIDPAKSQSSRYTGDRFLDCQSGPCADLWTMRDMPTGSEYEIYVKFLDARGNPEPASLRAFGATYEGTTWTLPATALMTKDKTALPITKVRVNGKRELEFCPAPGLLDQFKKDNPKETHFYTK